MRLSHPARIAAITALALGTFAFTDAAQAGTQGTEFNAVWTTLTGWMQGILGKIIAGAMILVGLVAGVARQSIMAFAIGVGGAIGIYNAPTILDGIVAGTVEVADAAALQATPVVNLLAAVAGI